MHTFKTLCILDVLFYIAYSARYSLFVLMCRKTHITHSLTLLNNIGPDVDEPVSRWKLNKANWVQFQTLSTTRLLEDTVRKADDPIESFASILINIAEETVPKTASKSKKTGGGRVVRWCWVNFQCRGVLQFGLQ